MAKRSLPTLAERIVTALYRKDQKALTRYLTAETVNLRTEDAGRTLLMLAASAINPDRELVRFLIERGADVNLADTALSRSHKIGAKRCEPCTALSR